MITEHVDYPIDDPVTLFLRNHGIEVSAYYLGNSAMIMGARCEIEGCEIVYRVEDDTLILIIYRRLQNKKNGLGNIFRGFIWFSERLIYDIPEILFMKGHPGMLTAEQGRGLSYARLQHFYQDVMGAEPAEEDGWFQFELSNYLTMRERRHQQAKPEQT